MSDTAAIAAPGSRSQPTILIVAGTIASILIVRALAFGPSQAVLLIVGLALGATLYHASFSFAAAYRRAFVEGDISGVAAQLVMLAIAIVLFAPTLAVDGAPNGALAPVSMSMMVGAFLFGIGMQLANGCASGTLYTAGSGNVRMVMALIFFCLGGFLASLHFHVWAELPDFGAVSIGHTLGWGTATVLQLAMLIVVYTSLHAVGGRIRRPMGWGDEGFSWRRAVRGPWPLLLGAGLLAVLNWVTLLVAGHPWSITWAFALWTAKAAAAMGWDPATSPFWLGAFQQSALQRPILADTVSI
ncbi:MAG: YeeE/YedE family protein, partial [Rhodospirillales bacterium]|nr:YeeE/YedE family protein [Rhodospirillales bacterium]